MLFAVSEVLKNQWQRDEPWHVAECYSNGIWKGGAERNLNLGSHIFSKMSK